MKKRISAIFAALALCLSLLMPALSAGTAETPHFLAINENLLQLEDRYIPIIADGMYYVPYPALDIYSTGVDLGIYPVYNTAIRTLTIYNREKVIVFDLKAGTCTNRDGTVYAARAVTRGGQVYVPAEFVCAVFGLTYSYFPDTRYGPMVRICSDSAKLTDRHFLAAAQMQMEDRLRDWRKNQTPAPTPTPTPTPVKPTPTPTPTPTPAQPTTTATSAPTPTPTPTQAPTKVDKSGVRTYMAFRADQADGLDTLLGRLEQHEIKGLFFFPASDLAQYDEPVRRVLIDGHAVGLILSGTTAEELVDSAAEGNRLLRQIAYTGAHTVLLPEGAGAQTAAEVRESGLLVWQTHVDAAPNGQNVSARTNEVLKKIETYEERVYILSDCSTSASALMTRLIPELVEDQYNFRLAVETEI